MTHRLAEHCLDLDERVTGDRQGDRLATGFAHSRGQGVSIRIDDLARVQHLIDFR